MIKQLFIVLLTTTTFLSSEIHSQNINLSSPKNRSTRDFSPGALKIASGSNVRLDSILYRTYGDSAIEVKDSYLYDSDGRNTHAIYSTMDTVQRTWEKYSETIYSYDESDRITSEEFYELDEIHGFKPLYKYYYSFTSGNKLDTVVFQEYSSSLDQLVNRSKEIYIYINDTLKYLNDYGWENSGWVYIGRLAYTYDESGQIVTEILNDKDINGDGIVTTDDWIKKIYTYDQDSNLINKITQAWDNDKNDWKSNRNYIYTYNDNNQQLTSKLYLIDPSDESETLVYDDEWIYDDNGNTTDYIFREKEEDSDEWYMDKRDYNYDLSDLSSNYCMPFLDWLSINNKLIDMSYSFFENGEWDTLYLGLCYYSDYTPTLIEKNRSGIQMIQTSNALKFIWTPNPNSESASMKLFDITGKKIIEQKIVNGSPIQLDHLKPGIYFYHLSNTYIKATGKIIIP